MLDTASMKPASAGPAKKPTLSIVEEATFRGVGQSLLAFPGRYPSILVVGVAFGLAHGLVEARLVLVPCGVALAWLRDRTNSVVPGMLVHGLFNGIALAVAVLG